MKMHAITRARRTAMGLTQAQLEGKLGCLRPGGESVGAGQFLPGYRAAADAGPDPGVDLNALLPF